MFSELRSKSHELHELLYHALKTADQKASSVEVTVTSTDGGVKMIVGPDKRVCGVAIDEDSYRTYDESGLAAAIMEATRRAKSAVNWAQLQVINSELGLDDRGRY